MDAARAKMLTATYKVKRNKKLTKQELKTIKREIKDRIRDGRNYLIHDKYNLYDSTNEWLINNGYKLNHRIDFDDTIISWE